MPIALEDRNQMLRTKIGHVDQHALYVLVQDKYMLQMVEAAVRVQIIQEL